MPVAFDGSVRTFVEMYFAEPINPRRQVVLAGLSDGLAAGLERISMQENDKKAEEQLWAKVHGILGVVEAAAHGDLTSDVAVSGEDAIGLARRAARGLPHDPVAPHRDDR